MANKTQCPNCLAIYKITDEQFNLSKGKVRCGSCRVPFHAKYLDEAHSRPRRSRSSRVSPEITKQRAQTDANTSKSGSRKAPSISAPISRPSAANKIDDSIREVKRQLREEKKHKHAEPSGDDPIQDYQENVSRVVSDKQHSSTPIAPSITQPDAKLDTATEQQFEADLVKHSKQRPNDAGNFENNLKSDLTIEIGGEITTWLDYDELSTSTETSVIETSSTVEIQLEEPRLSTKRPTENPLGQGELALPETSDLEDDSNRRQESAEPRKKHLDQDLITGIDDLVAQALIEQEESALAIEMAEEPAAQSIAMQVDGQALNTQPNKRAQQPLHTPFRIAAKGNRKRPWLLAPLLLLVGVILGTGLVYQLWHKQMVPWVGLQKIADKVSPITEPLIGKFSEKFEVNIPVRRDLSKLQLLSARTEAHPTRSSTTLLRVSMINHADIAQPYPWLEVSLTDQEGRLIARRALSPDNYLHNNRVDKTIGRKELKPVTIEFLTFPKQVKGYELKLLNN